MTSDARRVALVTGCSRPESLGAALCRESLNEGFRVFATVQHVESLADLEAAGCDILPLDVTDAKSIKFAAHAVEQAAHRLDALINNAAAFAHGSVLDTDPEETLKLCDVNTVGPVRVIQGFAYLLITTANSRSVGAGRSVVVNINSVARHGIPWEFGYTASKAGLHGASEAARLELKGLGVHVMQVDLCGTRTALSGQKMFSTYYPPLSRWIPNLSEIYDKLAADHRQRVTESAYTPERSARSSLNALQKSHPPAILPTGENGYLIYVLSWFPACFLRGIYAAAFLTTTVRRPQVE